MSGARVQRIQDRIRDEGLDALVLYKPVNTYYASGFTSLDTARPNSYTRPIVVVLTPERGTLVVPLLDDEPAREMSWIGDIRSYLKPPPFESGQELIAEFLSEQGARRIGVEQDYISLRVMDDLRRRLPNIEFAPAAHIIESLRLIKDAQEIEYLREASRLTDVAMKTSIDAMIAGRSEIEVEAEGIRAIRLSNGNGGLNHQTAMIDAMAIILGGARGSMPHEFSSYRPFEDGDLTWHCWLISSWGYWSENVRSLVLGETNAIHQRMLDAARVSFELGKEQVRPGNEVRNVFAAVQGHIQKQAPDGTMLISRSGHGSGLEYHEPPFVEATDTTVLEPGMVLTVEPGVFLPGVGGATYSDTLVVTENGHETLTQYPIEGSRN
ncbi:MAG: Xaa-Pro peptidase family protein [Thermomicrobiales bacterium]|nr:Xaa-Pro peptidase family protein [Thermomicrobiales bacterium]